MSDLIHDRTTVYNIGYHIVWSVKYRKDVLIGKVEKSLKQILIDIANEKEFIIKEMEIMSDSVHLFVSAKPKYSPSYIYKMLKGISGRRLFMKYPGLKKKLYKGHLWNLQTYVETVGHILEDTIEKYIQDQKKK
ncbi:MAG: IS200/IS605 family transposase [Candidatus Hydromicrobium sp.]